jgi:hypothetical protein
MVYPSRCPGNRGALAVPVKQDADKEEGKE